MDEDENNVSDSEFTPDAEEENESEEMQESLVPEQKRKFPSGLSSTLGFSLIGDQTNQSRCWFDSSNFADQLECYISSTSCKQKDVESFVSHVFS